MKNKLLLWMLLFAAALARGETDLAEFVPAADADYAQIADMRARFGGPSLARGGSSRGEMVLAAASLALDATSARPAGDWKNSDYDALYSLLQKYRDELRAMGFQQKQLEDELAALKVRAAELQSRLDKLQPKDGMKINGKAQQLYDDLLISGPGKNAGNTFRYRHGLARAELELNVTRGIFSGNVNYFMQRVFGNIYDPCTTCRAGVGSIDIEIRSPVVFQAGDLDIKMSPFTLWRNEDAQPFEPEPFRSRRQDLRDQLQLAPDSLRLRGIKILTDLVLFDVQKLKLEGGIYPVGNAGGTVYLKGNTPLLDGSAPTGQTLTLPYNTYFGAWKVGIPFKAFALNYYGTLIKDATDTGTATWVTGPLAGQRIKGYESHVESAEASLNLKESGFAFRGEYAQSLFLNPNYAAFGQDVVTGTAMALTLGMHKPSFGIELTARDVSSAFVSAPSQGRSWDAGHQSLGPFPTENSLYNPNPSLTSPPYGTIGVPEPPESHFYGQLIPPWVLVSAPTSTYLMDYDYSINPISPYGLATPNRSGASLDVDFSVLSEGLKIALGGDFASEKEKMLGTKPVAYLMYRGGMAINVEPWFGWPISLSAGYTVNDMRDGDKVAFSSTLLDLGAEWRIYKNMSLQAGGRHIDYNGTLMYRGNNAALMAFGYVSAKQAYDIGGLGLKWVMGDNVVLRMNYASIYFEDTRDRAIGKGTWWAADQAYAQVSIVF